MSAQRTCVSIIGCGHVGMACANALLQLHLVRELVLINETEDVARGEALDLQQAIPLGIPVTVRAGTYKDAAKSDIVILAAGGPGKFSGSRLDMLKDNVGLMRECVSKLMAEHYDGVLVLATNPVDVLTYVAQKESGLPAGQVIGTGTLIDSERLRAMLGEHLRVDARSVHASVIGEHGDSSVVVWSTAQIGGLPLGHYPGADALPNYAELQTRVRQAGSEVIKLKGNTCYAIGACVARICEAILRDERSILVVSTSMTGQYGQSDVAFSTPCVLGRCGVEQVLELALDTEEKSALAASAGALKDAFAGLKG